VQVKSLSYPEIVDHHELGIGQGQLAKCRAWPLQHGYRLNWADLPVGAAHLKVVLCFLGCSPGPEYALRSD